MTASARLIDIAAVEAVPTGSMRAFEVEGKKILVSNVDGQFYAIAAVCTHAGGDLSKGKLEGKTVTCPRHHTVFDITTGKCLSGPKIGPLKMSAKDEPTFKIIAEGGRLKVSVQDSPE
jgi:3-phenylpropionate/trans-cinnamate dioxygenase ferredoxin component